MKNPKAYEAACILSTAGMMLARNATVLEHLQLYPPERIDSYTMELVAKNLENANAAFAAYKEAISNGS